MNMTLLHGSFDWIFASIVCAFGLTFIGYKIVRGDIIAVIVSIIIWIIAFKMHGNGTIGGAMTATGTAVIFDLVSWPFLKLMFRSK